MASGAPLRRRQDGQARGKRKRERERERERETHFRKRTEKDKSLAQWPLFLQRSSLFIVAWSCLSPAESIGGREQERVCMCDSENARARARERERERERPSLLALVLLAPPSLHLAPALFFLGQPA